MGMVLVKDNLELELVDDQDTWIDRRRFFKDNH